MTFQTKYGIGDVVYVDQGDDGLEIKIKSVLASASAGVKPSVMYNGDWYEFELFPSRRELLEERMRRIQVRIDALKPTVSGGGARKTRFSAKRTKST